MPVINLLFNEGSQELKEVDPSWAERFIAGNEAAFEDFYERMSARVFRLCYRLSPNREDAEDATVQTFLAAHHGRSKLRSSQSVEAWIFAIAVNKVHFIRRRSRTHERLTCELIDPRVRNGFLEIELELLLQNLPDRQKLAFLLVRCEGLTYKEAASVMGRRMGTVQSDVFHAVRALRAQISGVCDSEVAERCRYEM